MGAGDAVSLETPTQRHRRVSVREDRTMGDGQPAVTITTTGETHEAEGGAGEDVDALRRRAEAAEARADEEHTERTRAERVAARAAQHSQQTYGVALASRIETATSAQQAAEARYRTAREQGDLDEELKATKDLTKATQDLAMAQAELERVKAGGGAGAEPTSGAGDDPAPRTTVSAQAQAWIDKHPRFKTDAAYHAAMVGEDARLRAMGIKVNSPAYYDGLDRKHDELEGRGGGGNMSGENGRHMGSGGAPPARSTNGGVGGKTVSTPLGPIQVVRRANGTTRIDITNPSDRKSVV